MFLLSEIIIIIMLLLRLPRHLYCTYFRHSPKRPLNYKKIFIGTSGLGLASYLSYLICLQEDLGDDIHFSRTVKLYAGLPLNMLSRLWGKFHHFNLPLALRSPVYHFYSYLTGVNIDDMVEKDLTQFKNLSQFFRRQIRLELRPQDPNHCLTSPCDGTVLYFGRVFEGHLEQVKGKSYTLQSFLGPPSWINQSRFNKLQHSQSSAKFNQTSDTNTSFHKSPSDSNLIHLNKRMDHGEYHKLLSQNENHCLYHCVIYLAPGDYHRFHSPCQWDIHMRRHFYGKLLSVNPQIATRIIGLFTVNERAVYVGEWQHGFFSYAAVGATNVGSINVYNDPTLKTNQGASSYALLSWLFSRGSAPEGVKPSACDPSVTQSSTTHSDDYTPDENNNSHNKSGFHPCNRIKNRRKRRLGPNFDDRTFTTPLTFGKGDLFGEFNFGSTIVLIFEAPHNFDFCIKPRDHVKVGEAIGSVVEKEEPTCNRDIHFE